MLLPVLSKQLEECYKIKPKYARGVLDFATAASVVQRIGDPAWTPRYCLTNVGRSIVAADTAGCPQVLALSIQAAILDSDADAYYAALAASEATGQREAGGGYLEMFGEVLLMNRARRKDWLQEQFPHDTLRRRITSQLPRQWAETELNPHFVRHHGTPRLGWARKLGHVGDECQLTESGRELLHRLRMDNDRYFWLGPTERALDTLGVPAAQRPQPLGGAWEVLRPSEVARHIPEELLEELAAYMDRVYPEIKLASANQAPTEAILPFVYAYEQRRGQRYDTEQVFGTLLRYRPSKFTSLRTETSLFGFYVKRRVRE